MSLGKDATVASGKFKYIVFMYRLLTYWMDMNV